MINPGTVERVISETTTGAGTTSRDGVIQSDSLLCALWVNSMEAGKTLTVNVYSQVADEQEKLLFSMPVQSAATTELVIETAEATLARFRVEATYTGVCSYEVYVRSLWSGRIAQSDIDEIVEDILVGMGIHGNNINIIQGEIVLEGTAVLLVTAPAIVSIENNGNGRKMTLETGSVVEFS